jgi:2-amino-4-hydroxy-6-hydroxymethyldihydropteridine diphosphokinase
MGCNLNRTAHMTLARRDLENHFPGIRFGTEMETEAIGSGFLSPFSNQVALLHTSLSAQQVHTLLKQIERNHGRLPDDKVQGIVRMDIDLLTYDHVVLKPADMEKPYVQAGIEELGF